MRLHFLHRYSILKKAFVEKNILFQLNYPDTVVKNHLADTCGSISGRSVLFCLCVSILLLIPWCTDYSSLIVCFSFSCCNSSNLFFSKIALALRDPLHPHINFLYFSIFSCVFLAALGLRCCTWAFSSCSPSYTVWASHYSGFSCCRARDLGMRASVVEVLWL